jgi:GDP/UDP-N,N'-diacetylbacillosamine 2-epimerase (hydrolysing)
LKIALLTSSRADYGIYHPLINEIKNQNIHNLDVIVFGTHNSFFFGETIKEIENDGIEIKYKVNSLILGDGPEALSDSMGVTFLKFSNIWKNNDYDLCFALGDRFEMFAAVYSSLPFNIPIAHISGGEITVGAIDNTFRDALTVISKYNFASTEIYKNRIISIKGIQENIYNVGALNIDNLKRVNFLTIQEFENLYNIDLTKPTILITFHPETVSFEKNLEYINELIASLAEIENYQFVITMPNADNMGGIVREKLMYFINSTSNAYCIESFGTIGYLSCMKHCSFMLGNTSSGFVEASFFPKYVINLGNRQTGRILTKNIVNCSIEKDSILKAVKDFLNFNPNNDEYFIYGDGNTANKIVEILNNFLLS